MVGRNIMNFLKMIMIITVSILPTSSFSHVPNTWSPWPEGGLHDWWDMENQSCWYCTPWLYLDPLLAQMLPISAQTIACEIWGYHTTASVKITEFCDVTLCSLLDRYNISEEHAVGQKCLYVDTSVPDYTASNSRSIRITEGRSFNFFHIRVCESVV
jgi:hypothetical protein